MFKNSQQLVEEISQLLSQVEAILETAKSENRDLSEDEQAQVENVHGKGDKSGKLAELEAKLATARKIEAKQAEYALNRVNLTQDKPRIVTRRNVTLKAFKGETAYEDAYLSGRWLMSLLGDKKSQQWCRENIQNAMSTTGNETGAALVPDVLENAIINLKEGAGVFRANATVWPMASDSVTVPRRASGVTTYYIGEGSTITPSDPKVDFIKLVARKLAALTVLSSEIDEDSVVALADLVAQEMAYACAVAEDTAAFLGDGTSTYGGITGIVTALAAGSIVTAASTHTSYGALTLTDFENLIGALPEYPGIKPKFYLSKPAWAASIQHLLNAAGGNSMADLVNGAPPSFGGYPVVFTQVMSKTLTAQASQPAVIFGDLGMGALLGERRGMNVALSDQAYFTSDQLALRCTQRYDVNIHGRGTATACGPIAMLKFAAS